MLYASLFQYIAPVNARKNDITVFATFSSTLRTAQSCTICPTLATMACNSCRFNIEFYFCNFFCNVARNFTGVDTCCNCAARNIAGVDTCCNCVECNITGVDTCYYCVARKITELKIASCVHALTRLTLFLYDYDNGYGFPQLFSFCNVNFNVSNPYCHYSRCLSSCLSCSVSVSVSTPLFRTTSTYHKPRARRFEITHAQWLCLGIR